MIPLTLTLSLKGRGKYKATLSRKLSGQGIASSIKQFMEERFAFVFFVIVIIVMTVMSSLSNWLYLWSCRLNCHRLLGFLDYFVKLTAVKPHPSAFGTIIDLDPLPFRHY